MSGRVGVRDRFNELTESSLSPSSLSSETSLHTPAAAARMHGKKGGSDDGGPPHATPHPQERRATPSSSLLSSNLPSAPPPQHRNGANTLTEPSPSREGFARNRGRGRLAKKEPPLLWQGEGDGAGEEGCVSSDDPPQSSIGTSGVREGDSRPPFNRLLFTSADSANETARAAQPLSSPSRPQRATATAGRDALSMIARLSEEMRADRLRLEAEIARNAATDANQFLSRSGHAGDGRSHTFIYTRAQQRQPEQPPVWSLTAAPVRGVTSPDRPQRPSPPPSAPASSSIIATRVPSTAPAPHLAEDGGCPTDRGGEDSSASAHDAAASAALSPAATTDGLSRPLTTAEVDIRRAYDFSKPAQRPWHYRHRYEDDDIDDFEELKGDPDDDDDEEGGGSDGEAVERVVASESATDSARPASVRPSSKVPGGGHRCATGGDTTPIERTRLPRVTFSEVHGRTQGSSDNSEKAPGSAGRTSSGALCKVINDATLNALVDNPVRAKLFRNVRAGGINAPSAPSRDPTQPQPPRGGRQGRQMGLAPVPPLFADVLHESTCLSREPHDLQGRASSAVDGPGGVVTPASILIKDSKHTSPCATPASEKAAAGQASSSPAWPPATGRRTPPKTSALVHVVDAYDVEELTSDVTGQADVNNDYLPHPSLPEGMTEAEMKKRGGAASPEQATFPVMHEVTMPFVAESFTACRRQTPGSCSEDDEEERGEAGDQRPRSPTTPITLQALAEARAHAFREGAGGRPTTACVAVYEGGSGSTTATSVNASADGFRRNNSLSSGIGGGGVGGQLGESEAMAVEGKDPRSCSISGISVSTDEVERSIDASVPCPAPRRFRQPCEDAPHVGGQHAPGGRTTLTTTTAATTMTRTAIAEGPSEEDAAMAAGAFRGGNPRCLSPEGGRRRHPPSCSSLLSTERERTHAVVDRAVGGDSPLTPSDLYLQPATSSHSHASEEHGGPTKELSGEAGGSLTVLRARRLGNLLRKLDRLDGNQEGLKVLYEVLACLYEGQQADHPSAPVADTTAKEEARDIGSPDKTLPTRGDAIDTSQRRGEGEGRQCGDDPSPSPDISRIRRASCDGSDSAEDGAAAAPHPPPPGPVSTRMASAPDPSATHLTNDPCPQLEGTNAAPGRGHPSSTTAPPMPSSEPISSLPRPFGTAMPAVDGVEAAGLSAEGWRPAPPLLLPIRAAASHRRCPALSNDAVPQGLQRTTTSVASEANTDDGERRTGLSATPAPPVVRGTRQTVPARRSHAPDVVSKAASPRAADGGTAPSDNAETEKEDREANGAWADGLGGARYCVACHARRPTQPPPLSSTNGRRGGGGGGSRGPRCVRQQRSAPCGMPSGSAASSPSRLLSSFAVDDFNGVALRTRRGGGGGGGGSAARTQAEAEVPARVPHPTSPLHARREGKAMTRDRLVAEDGNAVEHLVTGAAPLERDDIVAELQSRDRQPHTSRGKSRMQQLRTIYSSFVPSPKKLTTAPMTGATVLTAPTPAAAARLLSAAHHAGPAQPPHLPLSRSLRPPSASVVTGAPLASHRATLLNHPSTLSSKGLAPPHPRSRGVDRAVASPEVSSGYSEVASVAVEGETSTTTTGRRAPVARSVPVVGTANARRVWPEGQDGLTPPACMPSSHRAAPSATPGAYVERGREADLHVFFCSTPGALNHRGRGGAQHPERGSVHGWPRGGAGVQERRPASVPLPPSTPSSSGHHHVVPHPTPDDSFHSDRQPPQLPPRGPQLPPGGRRRRPSAPLPPPSRLHVDFHHLRLRDQARRVGPAAAMSAADV